MRIENRSEFVLLCSTASHYNACRRIEESERRIAGLHACCLLPSAALSSELSSDKFQNVAVMTNVHPGASMLVITVAERSATLGLALMVFCPSSVGFAVVAVWATH